MKQKFTFFFCLVFLFTAQTWGQSSLSFPAAGGQQTFPPYGYPWNSMVDDSWLRASPSSGDGSETITLTVEKNPLVAPRATSIFINGGQTVLLI